MSLHFESTKVWSVQCDSAQVWCVEFVSVQADSLKAIPTENEDVA